jgi:acetyltransferase-like isoleucine patch superfamily enzyme
MEIERGSRISITDGGTMSVAGGLHLGRDVDVVVKFGSLSMGANCFVGRGSTLVCRDSITIGGDALIAEYVTIRDQDHDYEPEGTSTSGGFVTAPIVVGERVWIGAKATVTRGVTIGDHAVVAANAVVTRDVPRASTVAGVPARVVKSRET